MRRPVLFWHNYKSVTAVWMEGKSQENSEGLRIPRVAAKCGVFWGPQCPA